MWPLDVDAEIDARVHSRRDHGVDVGAKAVSVMMRYCVCSCVRLSYPRFSGNDAVLRLCVPQNPTICTEVIKFSFRKFGRIQNAQCCRMLIFWPYLILRYVADTLHSLF